MSVLLTGFAPFAGAQVNSSWLAVQAVADRWGGPEALQTGLLPVEFGAAAARMDKLIDEHDPDIVIATGLAAGRDAVTPERVTINIDDARIPDNADSAPIDRSIVDDGPAAYFSTLPIKAAVDAIRSAGIASHVSHSAGTFVCNHVFYRLMHTASDRRGMRAGFVHVPLAAEYPGETGEPTMPLADIAEALLLVVRTSIGVRVDAPIPGGTLH